MIIFFYGENTFKAKKRLQELQAKFAREIDPNSHSLNAINGATTSLTEISNIINTSSLFTKKRLTIIEDLFANRKTTILEEFLNFLQTNNLATADDVLIIYEPRLKTVKEKIVKIGAAKKESALTVKEKRLFDFLKSQKFSQEFKDFSNTELLNWLKDEVASNGGTISPAAIQQLVSAIGNDAWQINNEIHKLINYKKSGENTFNINPEDVKIIVASNFDENIFSLMDALSQKNKSLAAKILEEQYRAGLSEEYLLSMCLRQFKIILQIKTALNLNYPATQIASKLKLHPFVVKKATAQINHYSISQLQKILNKLVEIDYLNKSGQGEIKTLLNLLITEL